MSDVLDEYRQWQARWPARVWQTHYIGCYVHHHECMIHRLVDEVERLRNGAPDAREQANTNSADFSNTLRNGAPSARETVPQAATTVDAAVVDTAPVPKPVAAQPPTCDGTRQPFDSASTTDHDAAPSAKAHVDAAGISRQGTGDTTREPAAWLLDSSRQDAPIGLFWTQDDAAVLAGGNTGRVFPLYRDPPPPALTDAEREAVEVVAAVIERADAERAATLRKMLERMGGER